MIAREDEEDSIEALQLATPYVMIAISDQTDLIQTKLRTTWQQQLKYLHVQLMAKLM